jgi:tetratricopeptide (TPR) repeat protein
MEATDDIASESATPMQDVTSPPNMSIPPISPAAVAMVTPNENLMLPHPPRDPTANSEIEPRQQEPITVMANLNEHQQKVDLDKDLEHHLRALTIRERDAPNSLTVATAYNNIGVVYYKKGDFDKALEHYQRALTIEERDAPNSLIVATSHNNIGHVYDDKGDLDKALEHIHFAMALRERDAPNSSAVAFAKKWVADITKEISARMTAKKDDSDDYLEETFEEFIVFGPPLTKM